MIEFVLNIFFLILHVTGSGSFPRPLNAREEKQCLLQMKDGDCKARAQLIEHNLRLVAHIVKKYYTSNNDQDDLISIGTIGLIKAIDSFNMDKQIRLATYASKCIDNEILMHFRNLKKTANEISINEEIDTDKDGNTLSLMDVIADEDNILDSIYNKIRVEKLFSALTCLDEREKIIIKLRYGITEPALTQKDTARRLGISRSYVSRLEKKALQILRDKLQDQA